MDEEKCYSVNFTEEELRMIMKVFAKLESRNFAKWRSLCPKPGKKPSKECTKQWILLRKLDEIKDKAASPLGLSVRKPLP